MSRRDRKPWPLLVDRLFGKCEWSPRGCWIWQGIVDHGGYAKVRDAGRTVRGHRAAYELAYGPIPDGMFVCHRCDDPRCLRPEHLFLGTHLDNMRDKVAKGRQSRGEAQGLSVLAESDVVAIRSASADGEVYSSIAKRYGVARSTIRLIVERRTWRHLEEAA